MKWEYGLHCLKIIWSTCKGLHLQDNVAVYKESNISSKLHFSIPCPHPINTMSLSESLCGGLHSELL